MSVDSWQAGFGMRGWLVGEMGDVHRVLKLANGDLTSWVTANSISLPESSWAGRVHTAATSPWNVLKLFDSIGLLSVLYVDPDN